MPSGKWRGKQFWVINRNSWALVTNDIRSGSTDKHDEPTKTVCVWRVAHMSGCLVTAVCKKGWRWAEERSGDLLGVALDSLASCFYAMVHYLKPSLITWSTFVWEVCLSEPLYLTDYISVALGRCCFSLFCSPRGTDFFFQTGFIQCAKPNQINSTAAWCSL